MTTEVYTIEYGSVDLENEYLCSIWEKEFDAIQAAQQTAQQILDDDPDLVKMGYFFQLEHLQDEVLVTMFRSSYEVEWWRIKRQEVQ